MTVGNRKPAQQARTFVNGSVTPTAQPPLGKKRYTSTDIALMAGVSQPTVSRAIAGSPVVKEATRKRILQIAEQLDYHVDLRASRLRTMQTGALTLLMFADSLTDRATLNPFFLSMIGAITRAAARQHYDLLVSCQQFSSDWFADYEKSCKSDGLILLGYGDFHELEQRMRLLGQHDTHFIRWGAQYPEQTGASIGCDNVGGCRRVTEHLLEQGRRRIAFLGDISRCSPEFSDRHAGYVSALTAAGLHADPALRQDAGVGEAQSGFHAAQRLLASGQAFDAIVAASDQIAIAAQRALHRAGRRVPDDVALVGFDDIPVAELLTPSLTTMRQDTDRAGELLVTQLIQRIHGQAIDNITLDAELIVRESCGASRLA
ncbi:LacI family DNA-binding transcriptional regulator [Permianibacter sp. IMCC34836]|uniref:LacI family DNA-binding transcriptional regulator n=1 Tax=Permianibacter fluminis TaxID=2738515 RepID=UPI0015559297|nr:LacI family DNA-binding transcriptional regulator [Permianibacter fluminis]NQD37329.1 LacI family DNA-binding transcriptional regulator [Permianibacter fluminis]